MPEDEVKKTSLVFPLALWRRAKHRAVEEGIDLRDIVIRGVEMYLATKPKKEKR